MSTADTLAKAAVIGAVGLIAVLVLVGGPPVSYTHLRAHET